ncbi:tail length tape measure protein [Pseudomonas phage Kara-mokiny kep-wari Wadjak 6]|nr:tail length tape measure protein [Pseudomonas phage Kara-mokiny kep-wari Wadjak 5]UXD82077.1 tail length tape measure protein [Pseudomonas phage Kara-mokiny kep-wari Wadjak 6]UXD82176.1 tail length tape measure protein [Pseudomonas phage Kara-mokiny kep-wari Wadjak 7]UXD82640.1 tail length tape measure protein [Pseudomonas phage Kara-mokiny kep-wari Wadjak 12]UXD82834.1 tail length tape measure protein [Pseudomonas phage Kara-mokiny kep-wari Wadjak 14]UXD82916.1 tail length tape measure pro
MSKLIPFNSIDGDVKFKLEVVDEAEIVLVDVSVSTSQFRKFWPIADSLCWDEEKAEFVPRYKSSYLQGATEFSNRALLAFAAGQYYLRADQGRKDESEGVTSDESLTAMELDRENSRLDECLQNSIAREDKTAEVNRQLQLRIRDLEAEVESKNSAIKGHQRRIDELLKHSQNLSAQNVEFSLELESKKTLLEALDKSLETLMADKDRLEAAAKSAIDLENKAAETNSQLALRIRELEAELESQKALREESDRSLDGSIANANNQYKLACEAREALSRAREDAEFYRIGMQRIAEIANRKPFEDC